MIACDECDEWFHAPCVGVPYSAIDGLSESSYRCIVCSCRYGHPYKVDKGGNGELKTLERGKLEWETLSKVTNEGKKIPLKMPELQTLLKRVHEVKVWRSNVKDLEEGLEGQRGRLNKE